MREAIEVGYQAFVSDGGEEFGAVYLDAISRDKNVAFYNLYGLANQKLVMGQK